MRRAFTLIELLVVIAVIAILAAILFPVFARAKAAAKSTADLSNLRQLGMAVSLYMADSDDTFMNAVDGMPGTMVEGGWVYYTEFGNDQPGVFDHSRAAITPYLKNTEILKCPAMGNRTASLSYAINSCLSYNTTMPGFNAGRPAGTVEQPSDIMLLGEEGFGPNQGSWTSGATNDGYFNVTVDHFTCWHFDRMNVLFADTHAKSKSPNDWQQVLFGPGASVCP